MPCDVFYRGLHAHYAKHPLHADRTAAEAANPGAQTTTSVKAPKVTIKHILAC